MPVQFRSRAHAVWSLIAFGLSVIVFLGFVMLVLGIVADSGTIFLVGFVPFFAGAIALGVVAIGLSGYVAASANRDRGEVRGSSYWWDYLGTQLSLRKPSTAKAAVAYLRLGADARQS